MLGLVAACGSSAPPPKEPEPAPLDIPPLPPEKPAATQPPPREVPRPPPVDEGPEAVPSPLALPCKADAECATHRCNLQYGECAFPSFRGRGRHECHDRDRGVCR